MKNSSPDLHQTKEHSLTRNNGMKFCTNCRMPLSKRRYKDAPNLCPVCIEVDRIDNPSTDSENARYEAAYKAE